MIMRCRLQSTEASSRRRSGPAGRPVRAFTLLEVLLATTIFAILGVIILSTFRTGTAAYEEAERQATLIDRARFTFDTLERDVHAAVNMRENEYNRNIRRRIEELFTDLYQAEIDNNFEPIFNKYGNPEELMDEDGRLPDGYRGNPFNSGIMIDLQMYGEPNGEDDGTVSFVTYSPVDPGHPHGDWGLTRVTYESKDGVLIRSVEPSVKDAARNLFGEVIAPPDPPRPEVLAEGVERFQVHYGYWFDEIWLESDRWNSTRKEMRNSYNVWTPEPDPDFEERVNTPGTAEYESRRNAQSRAPEDQLPGYMRITLELADVNRPNRTETFTTILRFHQAQETYIPNTDISPERRDQEIDFRRENRNFSDGSGSLGIGGRNQW